MHQGQTKKRQTSNSDRRLRRLKRIPGLGPSPTTTEQKNSYSTPREQRVREHSKRYQLSSSSSSEGAASSEQEWKKGPTLPRTPWSTDCEVDSPPPSTIPVAVAVAAAMGGTGTARARRSCTKSDSGKRSSSKDNRKPRHPSSVFDFSSHDENDDPDAIEAIVPKRQISPKLMVGASFVSSSNRKKKRSTASAR